mmetsp:Transcript_46253/g.54048  ORF Transcript_46253/g.54048 Transcript_46253/m.54048 type:complete len:126 (+) Transcript_46253:412-789(+)
MGVVVVRGLRSLASLGISRNSVGSSAMFASSGREFSNGRSLVYNNSGSFTCFLEGVHLHPQQQDPKTQIEDAFARNIPDGEVLLFQFLPGGLIDTAGVVLQPIHPVLMTLYLLEPIFRRWAWRGG